jgi:hypothetical protein
VGSYGYVTADRWISRTAAGGGSVKVSRQATSDTTNLPNIRYCARVQRTASNTDTGPLQIIHTLETANSIPFAGKTVTLSFYARKGANYSPASSALGVVLATGTGTDQNYSSAGYTGSATPISQTATLTTTWQRFTYSATLSASLTELAVSFTYTPVGTAGAADYFEVTGVQIDVGSVALPFRTYAATIQGELAACMRYFQRITNGAEVSVENTSLGFCRSTTTAICILRFVTTMRTAPSLSYSNLSHFALKNSGDGNLTPTAIAIYDTTVRTTNLQVDVASGVVAGNATRFGANSASATLDLSAEL